MLSIIDKSISRLFLLLLILSVAIVFETSQQMYYIERYQLAEGVEFWDLLKGQTYRWVIWVLMGWILVYAHQKMGSKDLSTKALLNLGLLIIALVMVDIVLIALIEWWRGSADESFSLFFSEYLPFFSFQKAPLFTLGYIALAFILHLNRINQKLNVEIKALGELRQSDQEAYRQLSQKITDASSVLKVKVGHKHRIIPIDEINYLEADDYCVKIHSIQGKQYTMRASLKSLEGKLPLAFLRVHRKYIVNMGRVENYITSPSTIIQLKDDLEIPVAKSRVMDVRAYYRNQ